MGGKLCLVAYVSKSLNPSVKNYPMHKLKFLALKWPMVDKLQDYLYGATFVVKNYKNPLMYLLSTAKLDATGHQWLATLSEFQFSPGQETGMLMPCLEDRSSPVTMLGTGFIYP